MRIRSGIFAVSAVGLFIGIVQGCATEVVVVDEEDGSVVTTTDASKPDSNTSKPDTSVPPVDAAKPDSAKPDTSVSPDAADAAVGPRPGDLVDPLAPKEGAACPAGVGKNQEIVRRCNKCGEQKALCDEVAGVLKVGSYGPCSADKPGAVCLPNERIVTACGTCGQQIKNCDNACTYIEGACQNQVSGGCVANEVAFLEGFCGPTTVPPSNVTDVRRQVCSAACVRGTPEACAPRPLDEIVVSQTPGTVTGGEFPYFAAKANKLTVGTCAATQDSGAMASVHYARIKNSGAQSINVTVVNKAPSGAADIPDTIVATYAGPNQPADRKACLTAVRDTPEAMTFDIPAGSSIVFHSIFNDTGAATKVKLEVHTNYVGAAQPLTLPPNTGARISTEVTQSAAQKAPRLTIPTFGDGTCPAASVATSSSTSYQYVEVKNPGATARTVDLATITGTDAVLAVYPGTTPPADDVERLVCVGKTNDTCPTASDPNSEYDACLPGVSIPANSSVLVYVANFGTTTLTPSILQVTTKN